MRRTLAALAALIIFSAGVALVWAMTKSSPPQKEKRSAIASAAQVTVSPTGDDSTCAPGGSPCRTLNRANQISAPGGAVNVLAGTYPYQAIEMRADLRNLSPGCAPATPAQCVRFVFSGVKIVGQLEIFASDVWIDGGTDRANPGLDVTGLIDTSTTCATCSPTSTYPDHVVVSGTHSASIGIHSTDTMTWQHFDVGPATVTNAPSCTVKEGPGAEIIVGPAGVGPFFVPTKITLDDMVLHDQNGDASARSGSDPCHWGGMFLDSVNGLTVEDSVFARNVIYNVEVQNFFGPASTNVTFRNDSFGCTVDWLSTGAGCLGQSSIQADGTFANFLLDTLAFGEPTPGFACYRPPCDFSTWTVVNNTGEPLNRTPPPLPNGGTTTTPTTTATVPTTTTSATTTTAPTTTVTTTPASEAAARDRAVAALKQTTVGYVNRYWTIPPAGSQWATAMAELNTINADQNWQLRANAVAELKLTTVGYVNKKWKTPPAGTHWANALNYLAKIT